MAGQGWQDKDGRTRMAGHGRQDKDGTTRVDGQRYQGDMVDSIKMSGQSGHDKRCKDKADQMKI